MAEHRDRTFHNRTLTLDGQRFIACRFVNADLRYKGTAPFELRGNSFEGYVNLEFARDAADAAAMVQELDRAFRDIGYDLELTAWIAGAREPVWRYHTLLPRARSAAP
jgi:hypothetical protein